MKKGDRVILKWGAVKIDGVLIKLYDKSADVEIDGKIVNYELEYIHENK